MDLTVQEDDCRLLQFFPRVSRKVFEQQVSIEFEKIAKRCEEHQMERELETRRKVERIQVNENGITAQCWENGEATGKKR